MIEEIDITGEILENSGLYVSTISQLSLYPNLLLGYPVELRQLKIFTGYNEPTLANDGDIWFPELTNSDIRLFFTIDEEFIDKFYGNNIILGIIKDNSKKDTSYSGQLLNIKLIKFINCITQEQLDYKTYHRNVWI